jgi:hypothetical protein
MGKNEGEAPWFGVLPITQLAWIVLVIEWG